MFLYFYTPLIDKYTREDKKRGTSTLIDNIYANKTQTSNSIQSGLMMNTHKTEYVTKHVYSGEKYLHFIKYQDKFNWHNVFSNNFQSSFSLFLSNFSKLVNTNFPLKIY